MVTALGNKELFNTILLKLKQRRVRRILIGLYVLFILGLSATVKAGIEIKDKHRVGPVYQTASFTPLQNGEGHLAQAPVVFVSEVEAQ